MKTSQPTTATKPLLVTYPLPWHVVADCISPRLVADNNATILAVNSEELPIIRTLSITAGRGQRRPTCDSGRVCW